MANEFAANVNDASVSPADFALPSAGSGTTQSAGVNLDGVTPVLEEFELEITAPVLAQSILSNGDTMTYKVQDSADNITFADVADSVVLQTGAGGSGAAAITQRYRVPSDVNQYVRVAATMSSGGTDASAVSATVKFLF